MSYIIINNLKHLFRGQRSPCKIFAPYDFPQWTLYNTISSMLHPCKWHVVENSSVASFHIDFCFATTLQHSQWPVHVSKFSYQDHESYLGTMFAASITWLDNLALAAAEHCHAPYYLCFHQHSWEEWTHSSV